jgi:hypothetical protein
MPAIIFGLLLIFSDTSNFLLYFDFELGHLSTDEEGERPNKTKPYMETPPAALSLLDFPFHAW